MLVVEASQEFRAGITFTPVSANLDDAGLTGGIREFYSHQNPYFIIAGGRDIYIKRATLRLYNASGTQIFSETVTPQLDYFRYTNIQAGTLNAGSYSYEWEYYLTTDNPGNEYFTGSSGKVSFTVTDLTYHISYSANGGSGAPSSQTKVHGKTLILSSTRPTRSGYTFKGWATSSTASSAVYQPGGSYTSNSGTVLYAVWERNPSRPTVTITPSAANVKAGTGKSFSVSVSGGYPTSYTYQWYYSDSQTGTGTRINGETSSSYTISSNDMKSGLNGRYYYCIVSNGQYDVESGRSKLTVYYAPTVTDPVSKSVTSGTDAAFSVSASGGNPNTYTYQWYYSATQSGTGTRISGATTESYTITSGNMTSDLNGRYYYCVVSNGQYDVESGRARLTVTESSQNTPTGTPANPLHHCTGENDGSDSTDWSYVYFGSYPQSEVAGSALTSAIISASYDANGDAWVNGTKYRRIRKSDTNNNRNFGDGTYRYFKWERIKWKVLKNDGSTLFVVADQGLDCKDYHDVGGNATWESSTIRTWLNDDFYQTAFSSNEQNVIVQQNIINEGNAEYGTDGGGNTKDKVFLLSIGDVGNLNYGFCENLDVHSDSRRVNVSDY